MALISQDRYLFDDENKPGENWSAMRLRTWIQTRTDRIGETSILASAKYSEEVVELSLTGVSRKNKAGGQGKPESPVSVCCGP